MNPIGGYIELQLPTGTQYHEDLLKLNTGRNALEYIIRVNEYTAIYLPYFTCDVLLEPIHKLGIELKYYHIDRNLDPILDFNIGESEGFVYTNYFGLKQNTVERLADQVKNLIIDNCQAFYSEPLPGIDTFYSCRKFFGVPDGSYLHLSSAKRLTILTDTSIDRFSHLIKSIDFGIEDAYVDYIENNKVLCNTSIKQMSGLTQRILSSIDYEDCRDKRNSNFSYLHQFLEKYNEFKFNIAEVNAPMVYPLLISKPGLKKELINRKIFVATYWPNVFEWTTPDMLENYLADNLIAIPVDHRYTISDMTRIINTLNQLI